MQDGTAAPLIDIAQPVRDEDRPASRHRKTGLRGRWLAFAAAILYFALGASALGLHDDIPGEVWSWSRTSLIGVFLAGLTFAALGFGVDASNRGADQTTAAVKTAGEAGVKAIGAAQAAAVKAVEASRVDMHDDHAALHRDYMKLSEMLGVLTESAARREAFEERRTLELKALRQEVKDMHELLAVMRQESPPAEVIIQRVGELDQRQDEAEKVLAEVAAKVDVAYTVGFTDGVGTTSE